ncbi:PPC domain-containing DNA-binding protein [Nocardiopsis rhodophaea]|uniref:PPC domain-containing DNA-binding protein n=1 Tax=Nocardiopsis rhodophaea TaxID=280238 RepID=UPI0031E19B41
MRSHELTQGRTFGVVFDHGENFFDALRAFCRTNNVRQGYIPMFIAGFAHVDIVGTCEQLTDPAAPVWSKVHLSNVEAVGGGTIAYDEANDTISPHVHVSVGLKEHSATGHTSHLLAAEVQFLTEVILAEIASPQMRRIPNPALNDVPLLHFDREE